MGEIRLISFSLNIRNYLSGFLQGLRYDFVRR